MKYSVLVVSAPQLVSHYDEVRVAVVVKVLESWPYNRIRPMFLQDNVPDIDSIVDATALGEVYDDKTKFKMV